MIYAHHSWILQSFGWKKGASAYQVLAFNCGEEVTTPGCFESGLYLREI